MQRIRVIDSHTAGEPTRVVTQGGPDLGAGPLPERLRIFREKHDAFRSAVVNEPRGSDVLVGALLVEPHDPACAAGVIFFNNVGYLGMCGHGAIGVVATLAHLGRIQPGTHRLETPVGAVTATLHKTGEVSIENVPAHRQAKDVSLRLDDGRVVKGDVAWGGNWFFLVQDHGLEVAPANVERLTDFAWQLRRAANAQGYPEIDHVELFGPPTQAGADSKNFVLCPGKAYDRSPCGTGTSAKLACLLADGKLAEGELWRQEGILGTIFTGSVKVVGGRPIPTIGGRAYVCGEATLILDPDDPFCWGIRS